MKTCWKYYLLLLISQMAPHKVELDQKDSLFVKPGAPQGRVLGPLLFSMKTT